MLAILPAVVQPIFGLGLSASMGPSYFAADRFENKSAVVSTAFILSFISGLLIVAIAVTLPVAIGELINLSAENAPLVRLTLFGCAATILSGVLIQRVQFEKKVILFTLVTVLVSLSATVVSGIMIIGYSWGALALVLGQFVANILTLLIFLFISLKDKIRLKYNTQIAWQLLKLGVVLIPSFCFLFIIQQSNKYILQRYYDLDAVGLYSVGYNLGVTISILVSGMGTAWYPFFMSYINKQSEAPPIFSKVFTHYFLGGGALCILYFIWAQPALFLLTDSKFHEAASVVGLTALAHFFLGLFSLFLPGIYYNNHVGHISSLQGLAAIASIISSYLLIPTFGITGAAVSLCVANLLMVGMLCLWNYFHKNSYPKITYQWRKIYIFIIIVLSVLALDEISITSSLTSSIVKAMALSLILVLSTIYLLKKSN